MAWINTFYKIVIIILSLLFCILGGFLIFRSINPKTKKNEIYKKDLLDIKQQWLEYNSESEPSIPFIYEMACDFEKNRIYTKISLFIAGLIIVCLGLVGILECIQ